MTRDKGASTSQRRSNHLTVENLSGATSNCQEEIERVQPDKDFVGH